MKQKVGFALTGSHCTFAKALSALEKLAGIYDIVPIVSPAALTDTRFFSAADLAGRLEKITGRKPISSIRDAEPIGPGAPLDLLIICPCTGNTVAKLALGITDTTVTMAFKAHMRNDRPVLLSISTNDGLGANAQNIGRLLNTRNVFFVPFFQDDPKNKRFSLVSDLSLLAEAADCALKKTQLQPVVRSL